VDKSDLSVEINVEDNGEGSERAYLGPEVHPLELQISGSRHMLDRLGGSISTVTSMAWMLDQAS